MGSTPSAVTVTQTAPRVNGICPKCGSPLSVRWTWVGGKGDRLAVRCTMTIAPADGNGDRWCNFGVALEGNENLLAVAA